MLAVPLALVAGFAGGWVDTVIMRAMDALFSFPPLVLALTVAALLGPNLTDASIAIAIVFVPSFVRLDPGRGDRRPGGELRRGGPGHRVWPRAA